MRVSIFCAMVATLLVGFSTIALAENLVFTYASGKKLYLSIDADKNILGTYPSSNGHFGGKLEQDMRLNLTWYQEKAKRKCKTPYAGSFHWGRVIWQPEGNMLKGSWSYCNDKLGSGGVWNLQLSSGNMAALSPATGKQMTQSDVAENMMMLYGSRGPAHKPEILLADFSCDGQDDAVMAVFNQDNPDGPFVDVTLMSKSSGQLIEEMISLDIGKGLFSICGKEGSAPEIALSVMGPLNVEKTFQLPGFEKACGKVVKIENGSCPAHYMLWSDEGFVGESNERTHITHIRD